MLLKSHTIFLGIEVESEERAKELAQAVKEYLESKSVNVTRAFPMEDDVGVDPEKEHRATNSAIIKDDPAY